MNTVAATVLDSAPPSAEHRHHRRSREEVEVLAKNFIATPDGQVPAARPRTRLALAAGGVALMAVLVVVSWPDAGREAPRPAVEKPRAAAEAEQWRARFEAEQERKRRELRAGSDYLAKMAAAESALLQEMGTRASRLTAVAEAPAKPVPARRSPVEAEPTPREAPKRAAVASAPPAPAPVQAPAPAPAAATAEVPAATVAAAPQCKLHVSQLSSSGTLTYEAVKGMKGARTDGAGNVLMPPVTLDDGRRVTFQVAPDGCMKWRRAT